MRLKPSPSERKSIVDPVRPLYRKRKRMPTAKTLLTTDTEIAGASLSFQSHSKLIPVPPGRRFLAFRGELIQSAFRHSSPQPAVSGPGPLVLFSPAQRFQSKPIRSSEQAHRSLRQNEFECLSSRSIAGVDVQLYAVGGRGARCIQAETAAFADELVIAVA